MLTKQEILLGREIWVESRRVREPRRTAVASGPQSQALVSGCLRPVILVQCPS